MTQTIEQLTARVAELEAENELLKWRKNVELAANTDNAKSKQQRELAGPMEMGQLLAGSTHKTSGDLEIERTKPVTWIHKGGGVVSDSRGKFIGCFSGDFRYRDRIICAINSESETSNQLAAEQLNNKLLRDALQAYIDEHEECQDADDWMAMMCSMEAHHTADEAISQPSDTSALDSFVAEKVKEAVKEADDQILAAKNLLAIMHRDGGHHEFAVGFDQAIQDAMTVYYELTRQRDTTVKAMREALECGEDGDWQSARRILASVIKESDGK